MRRLPMLLLPIAAPAVLTACASQGDFPSLAPRAVERELSGAPVPPCAAPGTAAEPAPAAAPVALPMPTDPALRARTAALLQQARRGEREFSELLPQARAAARRGGAAGSEPWIAAQQLISRLEAARTPTVNAVAELDALSVARSEDAATAPEDIASVLAAAEETRRLADAQRAELDRLNGLLSAP